MTERNRVDHQTGSRYLREFLPAVVGYTVALLVVVVAVDFDSAGWWKYPVALVPVIPAIWGTLAVARHAARIDEMQRSLLLEGVAVGFGVAMITAITLGFLAMAGLDTNRWGAWLIYSIGMLGWIAGQGRARLRRS
jgi:hypothetical protein